MENSMVLVGLLLVIIMQNKKDNIRLQGEFVPFFSFKKQILGRGS